MDKDELRQEFSPLLDGELPADERVAIEAELALDSDLLRELDSFKRVDELYRRTPPVTAPAGFEDAVRRRLRPKVLQFRGKPFAGRRWIAVLAAAAVVIVVGGVALLQWPSSRMEMATVKGTPAASSDVRLRALPETVAAAHLDRESAPRSPVAKPAPAPALGAAASQADVDSAQDLAKKGPAKSEGTTIAATASRKEDGGRAEDRLSLSPSATRQSTGKRVTEGLVQTGAAAPSSTQSAVPAPPKMAGIGKDKTPEQASSLYSAETAPLPLPGKETPTDAKGTRQLAQLATPKESEVLKSSETRADMGRTAKQQAGEESKFSSGNGAFSLPPSSAVSTTGEGGIGVGSGQMGDKAKASRYSPPAPPAAARSKAVSDTKKLIGTRVFDLQDGVWRQSEYGDETVVVLTRDSDVLENLVKTDADLKPILELDKPVIFRAGGHWYRLDPPAPAGAEK